MIYLTTGANGAGKTLLTLRDVRKQQLDEARPVYFHGFEAGQQLIDWGWKPFEPEKWQDLPDGSICIFDEVQNEMPVKRTGAVPEWINAIAQFRRKRGFDFWLICPHPSFIDVNVRRLIESPSWHRHIKRNFGGELVSVIKFNSPNLQCEKPGSGASGQVEMVPFPKEVFGWYKSATMHTAKRKIPKQVFVLAACALLVPLLGYYGISKVTAKATAVEKPATTAAPGSIDGQPAYTPRDTLGDYFASYQERIPGLAHTAPRFDEVMKPQTAPTPAACVSMGDKCKCYTNQGTILTTPPDLCKQIVAGGFFDETLPKTGYSAPQQARATHAAPPMLSEPPRSFTAQADGQQIAAMRARNGAPTQY